MGSSSSGRKYSMINPSDFSNSNSTSTVVAKTSTLSDPFHLAHAIRKIYHLIPVVLNLKNPNYLKWSQSFELTAIRFSLADLLHGKPRPPNISIEDWQHADFLLQFWIRATISKDLWRMISSKTASAHDLWTSLASIFDDLFIQLKEKLKSLKLGYLSVNKYCGAIKTAADKLADAGHPLSNEQIVLQTLRGLPEQYETFADFISFQDPLPTFSQLQSLLVTEEIHLTANISDQFKKKLKLAEQGKEQATKTLRDYSFELPSDRE